MMPMMNNPMANNPMVKSMQGNPLFQILQAVRSGHDPMPMMRQFAKQTPAFSYPLQMIEGKDVSSQRQAAFNMAKEYGIDLNQFASNFGLNIK